jgi:hypothetical protein
VNGGREVHLKWRFRFTGNPVWDALIHRKSGVQRVERTDPDVRRRSQTYVRTHLYSERSKRPPKNTRTHRFDPVRERRTQPWPSERVAIVGPLTSVSGHDRPRIERRPRRETQRRDREEFPNVTTRAATSAKSRTVSSRATLSKGQLLYCIQRSQWTIR